MQNYLTKHPLFMKEMPKDLENYPDIQALQALLHDDTPEKLAHDFNHAGNEVYKKGPDTEYFLKEAFKSYSEGIDVNSSDKETNAKLYNNRALIQIKFSTNPPPPFSPPT